MIQLDFLAQNVAKQRARAIATRSRTYVRRARSEAQLAELLPAAPEMGTSYHVISHGDVDALSYLSHLVRAWPLDWTLISTWCLAMPDIQTILSWIDSGRVGTASFCVGEIFPTQYPDEMLLLDRLHAAGTVDLRIARNHAKVLLGANEDAGVWFAVETSANVNTNPRIEQAALHMNRDLCEFYREFFDGIQSIHRPRLAS